MRFTDETLMAFADGELDEATRAEVERAMRADPALAVRVQQHIALRRDVFRAFVRTLDEPVPQRLRQVVASPKVIQLDSVRAARKQAAEAPRHWSWPEWGAIAATLVVGVLAGSFGLKSVQGETTFAMAGANGALTAHGKLDAALTQQLASAPPAGAGVRIGVSFVGRDGQYCRTFAMASAAGLACRAGAAWTIPVMVEGDGGSGGGDYRQAGSEMPPAVLAAMDARAVGPSLDAKAEQAAAQRNWAR
ncbi:MAG TPA: hypothetical protein VFS02_05595 [Telluria sp.]|nr:hypothetical protein [Telluria sp.]